MATLLNDFKRMGVRLIIIAGMPIPGKAESNSMTKLRNLRYRYRRSRKTVMNRIRIHRLWRGLTLECCAKQMGLSVKEARQQENPESDLRITQLRQWAIVLRVPIVYLIQQASVCSMPDDKSQDKTTDSMYNFFDDPGTLCFLRERLCELVNLTHESNVQLENNLFILAIQAYDFFASRDQADLRRAPRLKTELKNALTTADDDGLEMYNIPEGSLNTVLVAFLREERSFKNTCKVMKIKSVEELKRRIHHMADMTCSELQWYSNHLNVPFSELVYDDMIPANVFQDRAVIVRVLKIVNLIRSILKNDIRWGLLPKPQFVLHLQILNCINAFRKRVFQHEKRFINITAASKTGRSHEKKNA